MSQIISFPGLGLELDPIREFAIGSLNVHLYGVIIAMGLILAVLYGLKRRKEFGLTEDDLIDGVLWIVPFAIICARLYYCAFKWNEEGYGANPITILYIWKGGLAIYGGVLGAAVGVAVFEIELYAVAGNATHRHKALLVALARHAYITLAKEEIAKP